MSSLKIFASVVIASVNTVASYALETVVVPLAADTTLFELDPNYNFGGQRDLPAGTLGPMAERARSRLLFRVDVANALPAGAVIVAARLNTQVTMVPSGRVNSTFAMHRVLVSWQEGTKRDVDNPGGAEATEGEATWRHRVYPDTGWTTPGGAFGTDYSEEASASRTVSAAGAYTLPLNARGLADLRDMAANPARNHGWVLVTDAEEDAKTARRFAAREHRSTPPMLAIDYSVIEFVVPEVVVRVEKDQLVLCFDARPDHAYRVESSADLEASPWDDEGTIEPLPVGKAVFRNNLNESRRYFRILVNPIPR